MYEVTPEKAIHFIDEAIIALDKAEIAAQVEAIKLQKVMSDFEATPSYVERFKNGTASEQDDNAK